MTIPSLADLFNMPIFHEPTQYERELHSAKVSLWKQAEDKYGADGLARMAKDGWAYHIGVEDKPDEFMAPVNSTLTLALSFYPPGSIRGEVWRAQP